MKILEPNTIVGFIAHLITGFTGWLIITVLLVTCASGVRAAQPPCYDKLAGLSNRILFHIVNQCKNGEFLYIDVKMEDGSVVTNRITCSVRIVSPGDGLTYPGQKRIIDRSKEINYQF